MVDVRLYESLFAHIYPHSCRRGPRELSYSQSKTYAESSEEHRVENITSRQAKEITQRIIANVEKVIVGKHTSVRLAVMALMCQGHALIDGVPGVGKTMLARSIAISVGGAFKRIQCTSDLLPSDIIGAYIFDQKDRDFHFRAGPIMAMRLLV